MVQEDPSLGQVLHRELAFFQRRADAELRLLAIRNAGGGGGDGSSHLSPPFQAYPSVGTACSKIIRSANGGAVGLPQGFPPKNSRIGEPGSFSWTFYYYVEDLVVMA